MLTILSPSKTMDFSSAIAGQFTQPQLLDNSQTLIKTLRKLSQDQISKLMSLSDKLAELNHQRYQDFSLPFTPQNAKPAAYAFQGDVYDGLEFASLKQSDVAYAQNHLRMISGLYGVLRPLDLIQPYRLEMSTKLTNAKGKDLYAFWDNKIAANLNNELTATPNKTIINLASNEYFKAVKPKQLNGKIITPVFKEYKNGDYKIVMLFAKRARGMMANYIIKNRIEAVDDLRGFKQDGYKFAAKLSSEDELVFIRSIK